MKHINALIIICTLSSATQAQWIQKGLDIDGDWTKDYSGESVSINADGTTLATGGSGTDYGATNTGRVRIYDWNNTASSWTYLMYIDGEAEDDLSGKSVSLSDDGNTVAIGATGNDETGTDAGHVRIYERSGGWIQKGADLDGEAAGDRSGASVSISSNGNTVVIGAPENDESGANAGHVRIYDWNSTTSSWLLLIDLDGEAADDESGTSVSISSNGNTVAIGAPNNDGAGSDAGHVRVYEWSGSAWAQKGADIDGEAAGDESGYSVSINSDGNTIAIGAPENGFNGQTRVYEWSGSAWIQKGADIDGETSTDKSGRSVSISSDGNTLAVGAPWNSGSGNQAGHARVYKWTGSTWSQTGADIDGERPYDESGRSVSLSADGTSLAIGAPLNDGTSTDPLFNNGHTRIYYFSTVGVIENSFGDDLLIYPNPTDGNLSIDLGMTHESASLRVTDLNGKLMQSNSYNNSQMLDLKLEGPAGVYLLTVESGENKAVIRLLKE
ncbi:MAG: T9SS type A sorting domain-containing protein [Crocinitomicaceae bacterium]|nr:T9SS type A sorting domain-containing protein [Crocinitomicaceae bacterium]